MYKDKKKINIHKGHRARVRKRFIQEESLDSFEYHQILELILFYCIKMGDTNALAHRILNEYDNSLAKLLNADYKDIMRRCNISESTALFISSIPHIYKKYMEDRLSKTGIINSSEAAIDYLTSTMNHFTEGFYILYIDAAKKLIKTVNMGDCLKKSYIKDIVEQTLVLKASYIFVAHNIMGLGSDVPPIPDIKVTNSIIDSFKVFDIIFKDYLIFYQDDKVYSFLRKKLFDCLRQENMF